MVWAQRIVHAVALLSLIFLTPDAVLAHELVADESLKADWHVPAKTNEIIFVGDATKQAPVLRLKVAALKSAPCGLMIDSDAKSLSLASGTTRITVPANRPMTVVLGMSPDHPVLRVDDQDLPQFRGRWLQMCLNGEQHLMVEFGSASYVNMRRDQSGPEPVSQQPSSEIVPAPATAPAAPTTADNRDFIGSLSQSVFQIKVFDENREVFASGTGFVVDSDGLGLTNFHVVHGASGAVALFPGRTDEMTLELIAARPDLDLALVRIAGTSLPSAIPIESRDPRPGEEVWALGYPLGLGFTVNRGVVAGLRRYTDLPELLRDSLREYSDSSVWIQTDCAINPGSSGGAAGQQRRPGSRHQYVDVAEEHPR